MNALRLRMLLETKRAIKTILTLYEKKRVPSKELSNIIGGSLSTPQKRFKAYIKLGLMKKEPIIDEETDRVLVIYSLTDEGESIARKLSYVFDSEVEVFPVPKKQVEKLTKILEDQQEGTIENFILNCVMEKIKKHKVFK